MVNVIVYAILNTTTTDNGSNDTSSGMSSNVSNSN